MRTIDSFLLQTLSLAESARSRGNHPFGALLVFEGRCIAEAENTVNSDRDLTAHAELNLIRFSARKFSKETLKMCTLFSSTEPCAMCSGAIYWAGIRSVAFGLSNQTLSEMVPGGLQIPCTEIFGRGANPTRVYGPSTGSEFRTIHEDYWQLPRSN